MQIKNCVLYIFDKSIRVHRKSTSSMSEKQILNPSYRRSFDIFHWSTCMTQVAILTMMTWYCTIFTQSFHWRLPQSHDKVVPYLSTFKVHPLNTPTLYSQHGKDRCCGLVFHLPGESPHSGSPSLSLHGPFPVLEGEGGWPSWASHPGRNDSSDGSGRPPNLRSRDPPPGCCSLLLGCGVSAWRCCRRTSHIFPPGPWPGCYLQVTLCWHLNITFQQV